VLVLSAAVLVLVIALAAIAGRQLRDAVGLPRGCSAECTARPAAIDREHGDEVPDNPSATRKDSAVHLTASR
jgi:hypothetical protein